MVRSTGGQSEWGTHCYGWPNHSSVDLLGNRDTRFHRLIGTRWEKHKKIKKTWLEIGFNKTGTLWWFFHKWLTKLKLLLDKSSSKVQSGLPVRLSAWSPAWQMGPQSWGKPWCAQTASSLHSGRKLRAVFPIWGVNMRKRNQLCSVGQCQAIKEANSERQGNMLTRELSNNELDIPLAEVSSYPWIFF